MYCILPLLIFLIVDFLDNSHRTEWRNDLHRIFRNGVHELTQQFVLRSLHVAVAINFTSPTLFSNLAWGSVARSIGVRVIASYLSISQNDRYLYVRFCRWRHVVTLWALWRVGVFTNDSVTTETTASISTEFCSTTTDKQVLEVYSVLGRSLLSILFLVFHCHHRPFSLNSYVQHMHK